jgi:GNAT superfamily N-acetyltransferase
LNVGPLFARERTELLEWLDAGLRDGDAGALQAENPVAFASGATLHARVRVAGRPASHALGRIVHARANGRSLPIGLIGYVYTDPRWRRLGFARACVRVCTDKLAARGALAMALWTDLDAFYAPLGFRRAGVEWIYELDAASCRAALADAGAAFACGVVQEGDWTALEALYAAKPARANRQSGTLARLASAPACTTLVARRGGVPVAYASLGRGPDFRSVVHEWAGEGAGVLACFGELCAARGRLLCLASALDEEPLARLRAAGVPRQRGSMGMLAVPDPVRLWCAVGGDASGVSLTRAAGAFRLQGDAGHVDLGYDETVALLLGPAHPARATEALSPAQYLTLRATHPWPLYLWGFDSL